MYSYLSSRIRCVVFTLSAVFLLQSSVSFAFGQDGTRASEDENDILTVYYESYLSCQTDIWDWYTYVYLLGCDQTTDAPQEGPSVNSYYETVYGIVVE